jgi:hypothetical protein
MKALNRGKANLALLFLGPKPQGQEIAGQFILDT